MVLGIYYLTDFFDHRTPEYTSEEEWEKKPIHAMFSGIDDVMKSYINGEVAIKDKIILNYK